MAEAFNSALVKLPKIDFLEKMVTRKRKRQNHEYRILHSLLDIEIPEELIGTKIALNKAFILAPEMFYHEFFKNRTLPIIYCLFLFKTEAIYTCAIELILNEMDTDCIGNYDLKVDDDQLL